MARSWVLAQNSLRTIRASPTRRTSVAGSALPKQRGRTTCTCLPPAQRPPPLCRPPLIDLHIHHTCILMLARSGQPIPALDYLPEEVAVWGTALGRLRKLFPAHACSEFNAALPLFDFRCDPLCACARRRQQACMLFCLYAPVCSGTVTCKISRVCTPAPPLPGLVLLGAGRIRCRSCRMCQTCCMASQAGR